MRVRAILSNPLDHHGLVLLDLVIMPVSACARVTLPVTPLMWSVSYCVLVATMPALLLCCTDDTSGRPTAMVLWFDSRPMS